MVYYADLVPNTGLTRSLSERLSFHLSKFDPRYRLSPNDTQMELKHHPEKPVSFGEQRPPGILGLQSESGKKRLRVTLTHQGAQFSQRLPRTNLRP